MKNIRTCVACRQKFDKSKTKLIKITKNLNEIFVGANQNHSGRSCYVCENLECINKVIKNKLVNKAFKCAVNTKVYEKLEEIKGLYDK